MEIAGANGSPFNVRPVKPHLAQVNIAKIKAPLESEIMRPFVEALDEINALAEASPGYVWRFKTESGNATSVAAFDDPTLIVNISVWTDLDSLRNYVYRTMHGRFFARRSEWFEKMETPHLALWWIPAGVLPTVENAKQRLSSIALNGESEFAFTFRRPFNPAREIHH
jgi:hypothetical protein